MFTSFTQTSVMTLGQAQFNSDFKFFVSKFSSISKFDEYMLLYPNKRVLCTNSCASFGDTKEVLRILAFNQVGRVYVFLSSLFLFSNSLYLFIYFFSKMGCVCNKISDYGMCRLLLFRDYVLNERLVTPSRLTLSETHGK